MSSNSLSEAAQRLNALRALLLEGHLSTQEELVDALRRQKFVVTQSTISRDLGRLGAMKARESTGRVVYRLPTEDAGLASVLPASDLRGLILNVRHNESMIVLQTSPGSASLVARQLDQTRPAGILGTIAGDDTIFVAPRSGKVIKETITAILAQFV